MFGKKRSKKSKRGVPEPKRVVIRASPSQTSKVTRRRKKTVIPWRLLLWSAVIINGWAGYLYSPMTQMRVVRIEGALPEDHSVVEEAVLSVGHLPASQIKTSNVETMCNRIDSVQSTKFEVNVFGTGRLMVKHRVPVMRVENRPDLYVDGDGIFFGDTSAATAAISNQLVGINLNSDSLVTVAALIYPVEMLTYVDLAKRCKALPLPTPPLIEVEDSGNIHLLSGSTWVILGPADNLDEKFDALKRLILNKKPQFDASREINLIIPERPKTRTEPSPSGKGVPQQ